MQRYYGFLLVIVSAVSFGAMPVFATYTYQDGFSVENLLFYRFFLAFAVMLPVVLIQKHSLPRGRDLVILILMGLLGYSGQSFCYFTALTLIPAALVATLLYLYPIFVTLLSVFFLKETLTRRKLTALGLAVFGTVLVVGFKSGTNMTGIALGIMAAVIYSVYIVTGSRVMRQNQVFPSSTVIIGSAALFYFLYSAATGICLPATISCGASVLAIALVCTFLAIYAFFAGMQRAGAVNASLLSTFEPVTTVFLFLWIFDQPLAISQVMGIAMILSSTILVATAKTVSTQEAPG